jgi:hypothetical protein
MDWTNCSQNLDSYDVECTFGDGTKALVIGRYQDHCFNEFATYVHGTKCAGQFSCNILAATVLTYRDQRISSQNVSWKADKEPGDPWQAEWNDLLAAIRHDRPYNEVRRSAFSNLAALIARAAVHTGNIVTWEEMMSSHFQFYPAVASLRADSPAPVHCDARGATPCLYPAHGPKCEEQTCDKAENTGRRTPSELPGGLKIPDVAVSAKEACHNESPGLWVNDKHSTSFRRLRPVTNQVMLSASPGFLAPCCSCRVRFFDSGGHRVLAGTTIVAN